MSEQVYVTHPDLEGGAFVPRSALRQLGTQGWAETDPPADATAKRHVDTDLADSSDLVRLTHPDPDIAEDAWVPASAVAQHALAGWVEAEPKSKSPRRRSRNQADGNESGNDNTEGAR